LGDLQVTTAKIANGNISTAKIADNAVTSAKIDTNIDIAGTFDVTGATTLDAGLTVDTTTLVVDATNNRVGIGTASPSTKLHLGGTAPLDSIIRQDSTSSGTNWEIGEREAGKWQIFEDDGDSIVATFKSDGNVGIGTTSPAAQLHVATSSGDCTVLIEATENSAAREPHLQLRSYNTSGNPIIEFGDHGGFNGTIEYENQDNSLRFGANAAERMRINSSGNVLIGRTDDDTPLSSNLVVQGSGNVFSAMTSSTSGATVAAFRTGSYDGASNVMNFYNAGNGVMGRITATNGNSGTAVTYTATSDYRLKENITPIENGLERLNNLNPVKFDWKDTGVSSEGFIAHEAQEVFPDAVTGEKDGEKLQGMDYGRITPLLVKAIQEQQEQIEQLKSEIEALKS
jgi:hypothetical protein